jgi:putative ATPase
MACAERTRHSGRKTLVFVDEIHRFNKAQQDAFLPFVESGSITLIGATTQNPSFEVVSALLSRVRVFVLESLSPADVETLVDRAVASLDLTVHDDARAAIVRIADGDARMAYNILDTAFAIAPTAPLTPETVEDIVQKRVLRYDKDGDEHYNIISAFHKSIRNSDADAGLYWMARMLDAGEDPLYVVRRLVRFASEDIGLANPAALRIAIDTLEAVRFLGMPEAGVAVAQCVIYLAASPKSNTAYTAYGEAMKAASHSGNEPVPMHLRNAPTKLMKDLGYGDDYEYAHDTEKGVADMECLPDRLRGRTFYEGKPVGREAEILKRLEEFRTKRKGNSE